MKRIFSILFFCVFSLNVFAAGDSQRLQNYPGAKDEDELQVQSELRPPAQKLDRETLEENFRKNLFKKDDKQPPTQE